MNCKKAEELMVLYSELSFSEKSQLKEHLSTCASCSVLYKSIQQQREVISKTNTWSPEIINPVAFTDDIMNALPKKLFQSEKRNVLSTYFDWTPLQTSLAACSLVLVFTFAVEFDRTENPIQNQQPVKNGVALSTNPKKLIQAKRSRTAQFSLTKIINQNNSLAFSN